MPEFILGKKGGGESFKRNFIIYLLTKEMLLQQVHPEICQRCQPNCILGLVPKANNDLCAPLFCPTPSLHKLDGEDQILGIALVTDVSVTIEKKDHCEDMVLNQPKNVTKKDDRISSYSLGLGLSQPDSQSPVLQTSYVPDPSTVGLNEDDGGEDDNDGAPLRFPLSNTSQVNCELSIKKSAENKSKEGDEPSSKKGRGEENKSQGLRPAASTWFQQAKLTKEVLPEKDHEKHIGVKSEEVGPSDVLRKRQPENLPLAYCSLYVTWMAKPNSELCQDEMLISEYYFGKVEDMDDRVSMATLKLGEELEMNAINIWSSILIRERKKGSRHSK
ncbi:hypothetical protein Cgig2_004223 [Carnegiea gigantea]|uniref:Uncharacterized protein n=1 Tax=Carnegiea gigantea TaxID=171969 RepID=A0A9Q1JKJ2_9CARY|nr:hypothetical protein Cgig2_004223 [Carnegiea gigantea]